ncbi:hypothetical protein FACS18948_5540 [Clostridia bacterium]|nr:hypothetical protein FACS18948_5540 [Clostridia bacterium]
MRIRLMHVRAYGLLCVIFAVLLASVSNVPSASAGMPFSQTIAALSEGYAADGLDATFALKYDGVREYHARLARDMVSVDYETNETNETNDSNDSNLWMARNESLMFFGNMFAPDASIYAFPLELMGLADGLEWDSGAAVFDPDGKRLFDSLHEMQNTKHSNILHPLARFWYQTDDRLPIFDFLDRQWFKFRLSLSPFGTDDDSVGMSGIDRPRTA